MSSLSLLLAAVVAALLLVCPPCAAADADRIPNDCAPCADTDQCPAHWKGGLRHVKPLPVMKTIQTPSDSSLLAFRVQGDKGPMLRYQFKYDVPGMRDDDKAVVISIRYKKKDIPPDANAAPAGSPAPSPPPPPPPPPPPSAPPADEYTDFSYYLARNNIICGITSPMPSPPDLGVLAPPAFYDTDIHYVEVNVAPPPSD